jgi:hypothetical protein
VATERPSGSCDTPSNSGFHVCISSPQLHVYCSVVPFTSHSLKKSTLSAQSNPQATCPHTKPSIAASSYRAEDIVVIQDVARSTGLANEGVVTAYLDGLLEVEAVGPVEVVAKNEKEGFGGEGEVVEDGGSGDDRMSWTWAVAAVAVG